ncbi:DNA-processing protein DprA [Vibrio sp.]|uniref:DNA-processing protein DprA n=1 Tax=Vibrio sp. TaxID=678 RepID=UPI003D11125C
MTEQQFSAWLTFSLTPKLGGQRLQQLLAVDRAENLLTYDRRQMTMLGLSDEQITFIQSKAPPLVERCLAWQQQSPQHHIVTRESPGYPALLAQIAAPPALLFVAGQLDTLSLPQLAMVGSRNASIDGRQVAHQFAQALASHGLVITSGLALGIDGQAHQGALDAGGRTIAVLGSGLDKLYPARHRPLAERIVESGALVSEFPPWAVPRPSHFPRRNRIISGLSAGVLVVEAAEKSGSLITARYAGEQGRDVFALPGSIHNPIARGSNRLIKQGACLVQEVEDVLQEIDTLVSWSKQHQPVQQSLFIAAEDNQQLPFASLLANVGSVATPVDILASRTNIPVHEVMMQLLELELSGHVVAVSGGYIRKGRG